MHWRQESCRFLLAGVAFATISCGSPESAGELQTIRQPCLNAIAALALTNPHQNYMAANLAGPLGLIASSDPRASPYLSRQAEFRTPDRSGHFFAVDSARWVKALLIRMEPTQGEPRSAFFVIDRRGSLIAAGGIENLHFSTSDIADAQVRRNFQLETRLWAAAGPTTACRH